MINLEPGKIVFIDAEIESSGKKILDIGAVKGNGWTFHSSSSAAFSDFLRGSEAVGGHNILKHDLKYLKKEIAACDAKYLVDTLYLSPLLFPRKPYHHLVKDDKLVSDELNNPLNDAQKAQDLFYSEIDAFGALPRQLQEIYVGLLSGQAEFEGFFGLIGPMVPPNDITALIRATFAGKICAHADVQNLVGKSPVELAYALSLISVIKYDSQVPPWVLKNYPRVENVLNFLRSHKCPSCAYCN